MIKINIILFLFITIVNSQEYIDIIKCNKYCKDFNETLERFERDIEILNITKEYFKDYMNILIFKENLLNDYTMLINEKEIAMNNTKNMFNKQLNESLLNITMQEKYINSSLLYVNQTLEMVNDTVYNITFLLNRFVKLNFTLNNYVLNGDIHKLNKALDIIDELGKCNNTILYSMISKKYTTYFRMEYCKQFYNIHDTIFLIIMSLIISITVIFAIYIFKLWTNKKKAYQINYS